MTLTKEAKQEVFKKYGRAEGDTGSPQVQIALLTQRINELTEHLRDNSETFDLIVSSDTLVYFGDLKGIIAAFAGALRPNGLLVFTLEHAAGDSDGVDYRLELHGRYSHAQAYVERLLTSAGLQSKIIHAELRMEAGVPVLGLVIRAAKFPDAARIS